MGARSRRRRARRARLVTLALPLLSLAAAWVRGLTPRAAERLGKLIGRLLGALGVTRRIVRKNLCVACGRLDPRVRARFEARHYEHLGLLVVDFLRQPLLTRRTLPLQVEGDGAEVVRRVHAEGRGAICVAGHAGLWEIAGHVAAASGLPITSVAKLSGHGRLDAWVGAIRSAAGQRVIDARGSMWAMKKALDRREVIGINVDQEARVEPVFAPFFGVPAATSGTPALLHRRTGAPIVVVTAHRVGRFRYRVRAFDVIRHGKTDDAAADVLAITARINRAMEAAIRLHPEQWLWSHRRWRRRPPGEVTPFARVDATPPLELEPR